MPALMIDGKTRNYDKGTSYESIVDEYQDTGKGEIALVQINGKLRELSKRADRDGVLTMVRTSQPAGYNTYSRTAVMMLVKTAADLFGSEIHVKIEFSLGNGLFCSIHGYSGDIDDAFAAKIKAGMEALRDRSVPITKRTYPIDDAVELFRRQGMEDKVKLFHYRRSSTINVYNCDPLV